MPPSNRPAAEVEIDGDLVRALLVDQVPSLADLPLRELTSGWDNVIYRLGDEYTVRLPRREMAARLVEHEARWLGHLAPRLPVAVPAPVHAGRPALGYPWAWNVNPWFEGVTVASAGPTDPPAFARQLGGFLAALHEPAPDDAPANPFRGHFVGANDQVLRERLAVLADATETELPSSDVVVERWERLVDVDPSAAPPTWIHGDLHTANVLVDDAGLAAVIDFGDITSGDRATDLAVGWMAFGDADRVVFREAAGRGVAGPVDDATWQRAEAWALHFAVAYLAFTADDPVIGGVAREIVRRLFRDVDSR